MGELCAESTVSAATVAHHIKILNAAGLIQYRCSSAQGLATPLDLRSAAVNAKRACIDWPGHLPGGRRLGSWNYAAIFQRVTWDRGPQLPGCVNPTDVRHCSQHAGANVDFGDEGAVDWAFLGNLKQLRALLLG